MTFAVALSATLVRIDATATIEVSLRVTNTGADEAAVPVSGSVLLIDGEPWPAWSVALNGAYDLRWGALPPGESVTVERTVSPPGLGPGPHTLAVQVGDEQTETVVLTA